MRIAVYPAHLEVGGSQMNAVDLAAAVAALGHEVVVVGQPGALTGRIADLGLEFVPLPRPGKRPSPSVRRALVDLVRRRGIDVLHGYEWPPALETAWARRSVPHVAAVATVLSMSIADFIPTWLPLQVGTEQLVAVESRRRRTVGLMEPPVDLSGHDPDAVDGRGWRRSLGIGDDEVVLTIVSRLVPELKLEGTLTAIDVVGGSGDGVRLVVVGDGPARAEVAARAAAANAAAGREAVVLTGALADPLPAYVGADIAIGMGGSALRALAVGKPLVVQGEAGFFELLTPDTLPRFLWTGWYGYGDGPGQGPDALARALRGLVADAGRRAELGHFGRTLVQDRFSLERAAVEQVRWYERALTDLPGLRAETVGDGIALVRYARYYARKKVNQRLGRAARDDFNAVPVAMDPRRGR